MNKLLADPSSDWSVLWLISHSADNGLPVDHECSASHNLAVLTESLNSNPHSSSGYFCFTFPVLTSELSNVVIFEIFALTEI